MPLAGFTWFIVFFSQGEESDRSGGLAGPSPGKWVPPLILHNPVLVLPILTICFPCFFAAGSLSDPTSCNYAVAGHHPHFYRWVIASFMVQVRRFKDIPQILPPLKSC